MPKAAPYRLSWEPKQGSYALHDHRSKRALSVAPDSQEWFDWLASIPSFTFIGQHGQLTVRQETRSGGTYWYAYRRVGEKMVKRYLGRTSELTLARLEEVAREIATPPVLRSKQVLLVRDPSTAGEAFRSSPKSGPMWKMPTFLTPFIGREQEVVSICQALVRPDVRLLTLLGMGGIGKTRLGLQAASAMKAFFVDGICFVGLASTSDPAQVMSSIAQELEIDVRSVPGIRRKRRGCCGSGGTGRDIRGTGSGEKRRKAFGCSRNAA